MRWLRSFFFSSVFLISSVFEYNCLASHCEGVVTRDAFKISRRFLFRVDFISATAEDDSTLFWWRVKDRKNHVEHRFVWLMTFTSNWLSPRARFSLVFCYLRQKDRRIFTVWQFIFQPSKKSKVVLFLALQRRHSWPTWNIVQISPIGRMMALLN